MATVTNQVQPKQVVHGSPLTPMSATWLEADITPPIPHVVALTHLPLTGANVKADVTARLLYSLLPSSGWVNRSYRARKRQIEKKKELLIYHTTHPPSLGHD